MMKNSWQKFDKEVSSLMHSFRVWNERMFKDPMISTKIWYHRIDEAFLIISRFMNISFVNICKRYNVSYDELQTFRENITFEGYKEFKINNATYKVDDVIGSK